MTDEEIFNKMEKAQQEWKDLERQDPEEYKRRVESMRPIIDRYKSEMGIGDDEPDADDEE